MRPTGRQTDSVASRAWGGLALAPQAEEELLEPGQVLLALARGFGPRVLQVDKGADALPGGALGERVGQLGLEVLLIVPAVGARARIRPRRQEVAARKSERRTCSERWPFPSWRCTPCRSCRWRCAPWRSYLPSSARPPLPAWQCRPFAARASSCWYTSMVRLGSLACFGGPCPAASAYRSSGLTTRVADSPDEVGFALRLRGQVC